MNLGFDAKKALRNFTGIGNYSRRVIRALSKHSQHDLTLYGPKKHCPEALAQLPTLKIISPHWGYELWRTMVLPKVLRQNQTDLFHGLSNELPFGIDHQKTTSVVTLHDLIFRLYPETYSWSQRLILNIKTRYACQKADKIVAVSECTKRDLMRLYHVPKEKIEVVYQSIDPSYHQPLNEPRPVPYRYVLCVGTIEKRKNQLVLVKALAEMEPDLHLVLIGKATPYQKALVEEASLLGVTNRLHIENHVDDTLLRQYYAHAIAFLYMSRYEGFGIPVAEALAMGIPVIAANSSCLQEAGGPDSIYLDPEDHYGVAQAIMSLTNDPSLRQTIIEQGRTYVKRFNDATLADDLCQVYEEASRPRTLIIRLSALGDVAMTLPAVEAYAIQHPERDVYFVTQPFFTQLLAHAPSNLKAIGISHSDYHGLRGTWRLVQHLRHLRPHHVADLHNVGRTWLIDLLMRWDGAKVYRMKKKRFNRLQILHRKASAQPFTERYIETLNRLHGDSLRPHIPQNRSESNMIGIAPFARYANKTYPIEKIRTLVQLLLDQTSSSIHLFGARGQEQQTLENIASLHPRIVNHAGQHTLNEELEWLQRMQVMVTMDSANMHLASLVGTRVVSIWGSTTPDCGFLGWQQNPSDAIIAHTKCQPCSIAGSNRCPHGDMSCLSAIDPQTIVDKILHQS